MAANDKQLIVLNQAYSTAVPAIIAAIGKRASRRFLEFFIANIQNANTREAYARAINSFLVWCEDEVRTELELLKPIMVAAYIEKLLKIDQFSKSSVKQHLAAIRMLFDWLVTGGVLTVNPAAAVRGPKYVVKKGKTPVLTPEEARHLLDSIPLEIETRAGRKRTEAPVKKPSLIGLRDRALLAVMVYSFARVSAVVAMNVEDYYQQGKRWWMRLHEKGVKRHELPVHHKAEEHLDAYLKIAGIVGDKNIPLWRTLNRKGVFTDERMARQNVFRMVKRRCRQAALGAAANCHTFRATGITAYLLNGGTLEHAQQIAAHESPRTTKLYDRTSDEITLDAIERIGI